MSNHINTKEELEASAEKYEHALEKDIDELIDQTRTILTGTLVVGAGFWVAYRLFKSFSSDNNVSNQPRQVTPHKEQHASLFTIIKHTVMTELAIFLLGALKEKLADYLENINEDDDNS